MSRVRRVSAIVCVCLVLFLTVSGTAFAAGLGTHPHIDASDQTTITTSCTTIRVQGSDFTPNGLAFVFTIASTDHNASGTVLLPVNSHGRFSGPLQVCGITVTPELIEIIAGDAPSSLYSNVHFTTAK